MSVPDQISFWDQRYATDEYLYGTEPNAFLAAQAHRFRPGMRVLSVADGEGRNGVWLAGLGLDVHTVEGSSVAVGKAKPLAATRGVTLRQEVADLGIWDWPVARYDAVVAIFIQFAGPAFRDRLFARMIASLRPGGLLLLQGYRPEQLQYNTGGPGILENLYDEALLRNAFRELEILELRSHDAVITEGRKHSGMSALIDLVARKG